MGNCLKTQLKESVQNENLNYLGMFPIIIKNSGNLVRLYAPSGYKVKSYSPFNVTSENGSSIASNVTEYTNPSQGYLNIVSTINNQKVFLDSYSLFSMVSETTSYVSQPISVDISDMKYVYATTPHSTDLDYLFEIIINGEIHGKLLAKDSPLFKNVTKFSYRNYTSALNEVSYYIDLTGLSTDYLKNLDIMLNKATFNFETVTAKNLRRLNVGGCINVYGDLKVWAERMHSLGRKSGFCEVNLTTPMSDMANLTWNGQNLYSVLHAWGGYIIFTEEGVSIQSSAPSGV